MEMPDNFEIGEPWARYAPERHDSMDECAELIAHAIAYCNENGIPKLLVNAIRLPGFPPYMLNTIERYWIAMGWAEKSQGLVVVAIVARLEYIDSEKFGVTVARNAGMWTDVFTSELEATRFLQDPYSR